MFLNLPEDIILTIYDFLDFSTLANIYSTCKNVPKLTVSYKTYTRDTVYTDKNGVETVCRSYLLTNGPESIPGLVKHNYVEINLLRGGLTYHFSLYKNIYKVELDIFSYLQSIDWKKVKKIITFSEPEKIIPHSELK